MIKRLTDSSDISGSLPLVSVIQTDFHFACGDSEGVFFQEIDGVKALVMSLRGETATICSLSDRIDTEELSLFLSFRQVKNVLSDFFFEGFELEKRAVLKVEPQHNEFENIVVLSASSSLKDYKAVFKLLADKGELEAWYPPFSRKVNNQHACGVYLTEGSLPVSCAVAPFVYNSIGVIAGVFTAVNNRGKGLGSRCVKALLAELKNKGVEQVFLWCENKNIVFYENIGFSVCGQIYVKREE